MFTGLIEELGKLEYKLPLVHGSCLHIQAKNLPKKIHLGDSIAVNGVCQTVTAFGETWFEIEAVGDTLIKTTLNLLSSGSPLNLEAALRADALLGGHLVSGHVSGIGKVVQWNPRTEGGNLEIEVPSELLPFTAPEGSLTVDGISLTIAEVKGNLVRLSIIPHTQKNTILQFLRIGQSVNLEPDLLIKYLSTLMTGSTAAKEETPHKELTVNLLNSWGY